MHLCDRPQDFDENQCRKLYPQVAEQVVCDMQTQVELLVSDLQRTEAAVQASRQELTKAQEQTKTTEEDEKNLQKLSSALSAIATMSGPLQRLLEIVQSDSPSRDALAIAEPLPEVLVQIVPEDTLTVSWSYGSIHSFSVSVRTFHRSFELALT